MSNIKLVAGVIILAILAVAAERFANYINARAANPGHDKNLWGLKLSTVIVLLLILVVIIGAMWLDKCRTHDRLRHFKSAE